MNRHPDESDEAYGASLMERRSKDPRDDARGIEGSTSLDFIGTGVWTGSRVAETRVFAQATRNPILAWCKGAMVLLTVGLLPGCISVKDMAIRQLGSALADSSGGAFAAEADLEFAGEALPFSLKLIESLLYAQPDNPELLLAAASGFTQYAYVWVQQKGDLIEDEDFSEALRQRGRARAFYARAHNYALTALEELHPGFREWLHADPTTAASTLTNEDLPLLYWSAASLGAMISVGKNDTDLIARLPEVFALGNRAYDLDARWSAGAPTALMMQLELVDPAGGSGAADRARELFRRVLTISEGKSVGPYVTYAESISVPEQNRGEFVSMLNQALAIDTEATPENRLANVAMQARAKWLLSRVDDLFLGP